MSARKSAQSARIIDPAPIDIAYIDTSALARWYLNEPGSETFTEFLLGLDEALISSLTLTEIRSLLARRRRMGDFAADTQHESVVFAAFMDDVMLGHLRLCPVRHEHFTEAANLISRFPESPLRTLDALHLSVARHEGTQIFATADRIQSEVAVKLGFAVRLF